MSRKRVSRASLNYVVDVAIGVGFLLAAVSGIVLYFVPGGFQGGRNPQYLQAVLGLTHHQWDGLHTWSSFVMIAGVLGHLMLHWKWMVCMTKKLLTRRKPIRTPEMVVAQGEGCG